MARNELPIAGLVETSFVDWDGKLSSVIFTMGCNFRCGFCHNGKLVEDYDDIEAIPESDIFRSLKTHNGWIDGVVITGGEPTIHKKSLLAFTKKLKDMGLQVKLDTNGTNPDVLKEMLSKGLIDYVAMDVKAPLTEEKYGALAGIKPNLENIRMSIEILKSSKIGYEFRTTVMPDFLTESDIIEIAKTVSGAKAYFLQQYRASKAKDVRFRGIEPYTDEDLEAMAKKASKHVPTQARIR